MAQQERLWNPAYLLLAVSNFFSWLSYNMVAPVVTGYLQTLGASVFVCGIAGGMFAFTSCLSRPFSGMMSDRMNRKMLMSGFTMLKFNRKGGHNLLCPHYDTYSLLRAGTV